MNTYAPKGLRLRSTTTLSIAFALAAAIFVSLTPPRALADSWTPVAADLEMKEVSLSTLPFLGTKVLFFRSSLKDYRFGVLRATESGVARSSIQELVEKSKAVIGINANFFDEKGEPLGTVVSQGIVRNPPHLGGGLLTGVVQARHVERGLGVEIVSRNEFKPETIVEAIQSGPRLLAQGAIVEGIGDSSRSRRSGVCVDAKRRLLIFVVSSTLIGLTIQEVQTLLLSDDIGCVDALNLDGGGSTQLYFNPANAPSSQQKVPVLVEGEDIVPVGIGLFVK